MSKNRILLCLAPVTCIKLQSRVTSSGATVVSLIFFFIFSFSLGGLGVDALAEFCEWAGGESNLFFG